MIWTVVLVGDGNLQLTGVGRMSAELASWRNHSIFLDEPLSSTSVLVVCLSGTDSTPTKSVAYDPRMS